MFPAKPSVAERERTQRFIREPRILVTPSFTRLLTCTICLSTLLPGKICSLQPLSLCAFKPFTWDDCFHNLCAWSGKQPPTRSLHASGNSRPGCTIPSRCWQNLLTACNPNTEPSNQHLSTATLLITVTPLCPRARSASVDRGKACVALSFVWWPGQVIRVHLRAYMSRYCC